MGNNLKFNSSVCTSIKQSQRLLDLGLKPETADCTWAIINGEPVSFAGQTKIDCSKITINGNKMEKNEIIHYPAWSLHRLLEIAIKGNKTSLGLDIIHKNNIEDCYERLICDIERMIGYGYFNKEYLKQ